MWFFKAYIYTYNTLNVHRTISTTFARFFPPSHPETEDGVQTDAGEGLERGGDAVLLGAHCFGPAGLH